MKKLCFKTQTDLKNGSSHPSEASDTAGESQFIVVLDKDRACHEGEATLAFQYNDH